MKVDELGGTWQMAPVALPGVAPEQVTNWLATPVPSHWQEHPELRRHAGVVLYRRSFAWKPEPGERLHLVFPGIFYYSTIYLNGRRLGNHEGYFTPQRYDITDLRQAENELVVEAHCPDEKDRHSKRMITGVFSHWDCLDPTTNPGGIWLAPEIHTTGPYWLDGCYFQTDDLDGGDATVTVRLEVIARQTGQVKCEIELAPDGFAGQSYRFEHELELDEGRNKLAFSYHLDQPALWWTHDRGRPNLYKLTVTVKDGRQISDEFVDHVGIRTIRFDDWICRLNGQRLYLRGSNHPPTDTRLARVTSEDCERDVRLAVEANMNILRVHAHVDHPHLYRAADRAGLLLSQDFPMQWSYREEVKPVAERMIQDMARLLFNRPSIAYWTCHNEPIYLVDTKDERRLEVVKSMFTIFVWSWNRNVLDAALQKAVAAVDGTRFVNQCSGEPWTPWQTGTDTHFYFGWYRVQGKSMRRFDGVCRKFPKNLHFVTEFGAQSFPNLESCRRFMAEDLKQIDWKKLEAENSLQIDLMNHWVGLQQPDLATLVEKSQAYQAEIHRFYVDRIRRAKYDPNGGVVQFMFTDPNPAIQWSVLDYWRVPKRSYYALRDAFRPVYPFVLLSADQRRQGGPPLRLEVFVVNDTPDDLGEVPLTLAITDAQGRVVSTNRMSPRVGPDSPAVPCLTLDESPETPGDYTVTLVMDRPGDRFENVYRFAVV
jgi:beta-mannosidase